MLFENPLAGGFDNSAYFHRRISNFFSTVQEKVQSGLNTCIKLTVTVFLEPHFKGQRKGWIEVVCGCMFSGKTEELIRRLRRAKIAEMKVEVFKPKVDTRYDEIAIVSHDTTSVLVQPVGHSSKLLEISEDTTVVGVDEAQFFDMDLPEVCQELALRGVRVIIAGLDMDYKWLS